MSPSAWAVTQIKISNLSYELCPADMANNMVLGGGVMAANCFLVSGETDNPTNKTVYDADVFGRIYDANGNDAMPERGRVGAIAEVPPGKTPFQIMISVPADQPEPLTLKQFKAAGFSRQIRR